MKEIKVVIGKNFGDEGKGAAVDRFCRGKRALVVRHNGGAQAGHTVEEGSFRFVFHQLGSGSLRGASTYWSHTFIPDLLKLSEEIESFKVMAGKAGASVKIYAHSDCACATVYDVLLNSLTEQVRGSKKHGSCGMGIYETLCRTRDGQYALYLKDFINAETEDIADRLLKIRDEYVCKRTRELHAGNQEQWERQEIQKWLELIADENILWNAALRMCDNFKKYIVLADWKQLAGQYDTIVFENAQGLMLDMGNMEYYPHLTPSHTGLTNAAELLQEIEASGSLEIAYISRTYVTRHGAGRLDYECDKADINPHMQDATNVPNAWQDSLRYGKHPWGEEFFRYIRKDLQVLETLLKDNKDRLQTRITLWLTHADETGDKVIFADKTRTLEEVAVECKKQGIAVHVFERQGKCR